MEKEVKNVKRIFLDMDGVLADHKMEGLEYEPMFCIFCGYTLHEDDIEEQ